MARHLQSKNQLNPNLPVLQGVGSRAVRLCLSTLGFVVFAFVMTHPNRVIAKVTMITPVHTQIEEYFSQEPEAHQACNAFATSHGYAPTIYCHHAYTQPLWEAGWLCETYAQQPTVATCSAVYLGDFYYKQCPDGQLPDRETGKCGLPKSNGGSCPVDQTGPVKTGIIDIKNPINAGTGNKWQHETDLPGGAFSA